MPPNDSVSTKSGFLNWPKAVLAFFAGSGVALSFWLFSRGNQQIGALPAWYFLVVVLWPKSGKRPSKARHLAQERIARKRIRILCVIAALSWSVNGIGFLQKLHNGTPPRDSIVRQLDEADGLARRGLIDKALQKLKTVSVPSSYPLDKARLHHNMGILLLQKRRTKEAKEQFLLSLFFCNLSNFTFCCVSNWLGSNCPTPWFDS